MTPAGPQALYGVVINVHALGATVRLDDGSLGAVPAPEAGANRTTLVRAHNRKERLAFRRIGNLGRHPALYLAEDPRFEAEPGEAPVEAGGTGREGGFLSSPRPFVPRLVDAGFERQLSEYLKSTEEWAPADRPPPAERHFVRKKRRAVRFEARDSGA